MIHDTLTQAPIVISEAVVAPQQEVVESPTAPDALAGDASNATAGSAAGLQVGTVAPDNFFHPSLAADSLAADSLACDSLKVDSLTADSLVVVAEIPAPPTGDVEGVVRAQRIGESDGVGFLTIVCFLLLIDILCRSWKYLHRAISDFFYPTDHNNMYDDNTPDNHLHGGLPLVLLQAGSISLLTYCVFPDIPLYLWYALALGYVVIKVGLYWFVNCTYFPPASRRQWRAGCKLLYLLQGVLIGLVSIAGIYGGLAYNHLILAMVLAVGVVKILLLIKTLRTFFKGTGQLLHFILYFCTLEIAPIVALLAISRIT